MAKVRQKLISATSGAEYPFSFSEARMFLRFKASFLLGAVKRTISQPASIIRMDCATDFSVSMVFVVVMDWRQSGLFPPITRFPIRTSIVVRRLRLKRSAQYVLILSCHFDKKVFLKTKLRRIRVSETALFFCRDLC